MEENYGKLPRGTLENQQFEKYFGKCQVDY